MKGPKNLRISKKIRELNAGLEKSGWRYPVEAYKQGTPLTLAAYDTEQLWETAGACSPTLAWMAEQDGGVFDSIWAYYRNDDADPYFDARVAEQHYLVNAYFDAHWLLIGKDTPHLVHPVTGIMNASQYKTYLDVYRDLVPKLSKSPDVAVIVPREHNYDEVNVVWGDEKSIGFYADRPFYIPDKGNPKGNIYPLKKGDSVHAMPNNKRSGFGRLQFYLWPEIYFRKALGFTDSVSPKVLKKFGIKKVIVFFTDPGKWQAAGFKVEIGDRSEPAEQCTREDGIAVHANLASGEFAADKPAFSQRDQAIADDMWRITNRILDRWRHKACGLSFGMWQSRADPLHLGMFIRNRYFAVYHPDWRMYLPKAAKIARKQLHNGHMAGGGYSFNHDGFAMFAEKGAAAWHFPNVCGAPTIKRGMRYKFPKPEVAAWECEYSDAYLEQCARQKKIGVSLIWTITEPNFVAGMPNMLELHRIFQGKGAFAIHSLPWFEWYPEWIQKMYTRLYAPYIEPILFDVGLSETFAFRRDKSLPLLPRMQFKEQMSFYHEMIADIMGKEYIPIGYHAAEQKGHENVAPYRVMVPKELGMKYAITADNSDDLYKTIHYVDRDYMVVHNINNAHYPIEGPSHQPGIYDIEKSRKGPYALFSLRYDTGGTFLIGNLNYQGGTLPGTGGKRPTWPLDAATPPIRVQNGVKTCSGYYLAHACWKIRYVARGGLSGRLFPCKPHELTRYTRLIHKAGG